MEKLMLLGMFLFFPKDLFSQGIILSPHRGLYVEVELGSRTAAVKYGSPVYVENTSSLPLRISVDIKKPSYYKRKNLFGYVDIPNEGFVKSWEFELPPNSKRPVPIVFEIPDFIEYYNQKWEGMLVIKTISGNIGVELMGQILIETKGREIREYIRNVKYNEEFLLTPSTIIFDRFKDEKSVYIHNTSTLPLTFLIVSESPPLSVIDMFIPLSEGYERLEDEEWVEPKIDGEEKIKRIKQGREIQPQKKVTLQPNEIKEMKVIVKVSSKKEFENKKFESYIFVRSPFYDKTKFVRLRINGRK